MPPHTHRMAPAQTLNDGPRVRGIGCGGGAEYVECNSLPNHATRRHKLTPQTRHMSEIASHMG